MVQRVIADLHVHSRFSRATSSELTIENLHLWALKKGLSIVGTGDFTHPAWLEEIRETLVEDGSGFLELRSDLRRRVEARVPKACAGRVKFVLQTEVSCVYKYGGRLRKVHNLVLFPTLRDVERFNASLARIGNLRSDGRPILGLDSRNLLEIALEACPDMIFIPAHIWTPWFSVLGSKSGFESIADCYRDLVGHIHAIETGLSSDPAMNWRISSLDRFSIVSSSDAHSPQNLGREATVFAPLNTFAEMARALSSGEGLLGTIEFFPEEGKYHLDGHRKCSVRFTPEETAAAGGRCPVCGRPLTIGVLNRVHELADRAPGEPRPNAKEFISLIGLDQILAEVLGIAGRTTRRVAVAYDKMLAALGPELYILTECPLKNIGMCDPRVRAAVERVRRGEVHLEAGYDGKYGSVKIFSPKEAQQLIRRGG